MSHSDQPESHRNVFKSDFEIIPNYDKSDRLSLGHLNVVALPYFIRTDKYEDGLYIDGNEPATISQ